MSPEHTTPLDKKDWEEPVCPLCMATDNISPIPVGRVLEKLDSYFAKNDMEAAEKHLSYWRTEAENGGDRRGLLTVLNEQIGIYRKQNKKNEGLAVIREALDLAKTLQLSDSITMGTTLCNAATAYKAFGMPEEALPLYEEAMALYQKLLPPTDARLGGLCNNMALTELSLSHFDRAHALFEQALSVMKDIPNGEMEMAITYCNLADLCAAEHGVEGGEAEIAALLERAMELLRTKGLPHDGYYAFVASKCAPTFGFYGFFAYEYELNQIARDIYERA